MEIIIDFESDKLKLETNKVYSVIAYHEKNKEDFFKKIITSNKDKITYVNLNNYDNMFNSNIYLDITHSLKNIEIVKLQGFLDLFKLDRNIMQKNFYEISNSERKKIILISAFLSDKQLLFIDNATLGMDRESKLEFSRIIKHEKRNGKIIILFSMDSNFIYENSDKIIDIEKSDISDVNKFFSGARKLEKYFLKMPCLEQFRKKVLKIKKIRLSKTKNVNDLIKDVYRSVQ